MNRIASMLAAAMTFLGAGGTDPPGRILQGEDRISDLASALERSPDDGRAARALALALVEGGLAARGEALFANLRERFGDRPALLAGEARFLAGTERREEAAALATGVLRSDRAEEDASLRLLAGETLTILHSERRSWREAIESGEAALEAAREMRDAAAEGEIARRLAIACRLSGDLEASAQRFLAAAEAWRRAAVPREEGRSLRDASEARFAIGDLEGARSLAVRAVDLAEAAEDDELLAAARLRLAESMRALGRLDEARGEFAGAAEAARRLGSVGLGSRALYGEGVVLQLRGDPVSALEVYGRALEGARRARDVRAVRIILLGIASASLEVNDSAEALRRSSYVLREAEETHDRELLWQARSMMGHAHRERGEFDEAARNYAASLSLVEALRALGGSGDAVVSFLDGRLHPFLEYVGLLAEWEDREPEASRALAALEVVERSRARSFLEWLDTSGFRRSALVPEEVLGREREAETRVRSAAAELLLSPSGADARAPFRRRLEEAERDLQEITEEIARTDPDRARLGQGEVLRGEALAEALPPEAALVEFLLGAEESFAIRLAPKDAAIATLPGRAAIEGLVREYLGLLRDPLAPLASLDGAGLALYRLLLEPILEGVPPGRLLLSPDGILHHLPFESLRTAPGGSAPYLVERGPVSYLPSLSVAAALRPRGSDGGDLDLLAISYAGGGGESRLPFADREARSVAATFAPGRARLLLGPEATKAAFRAGAGAARIIHVAAHGSFEDAAPERSGIDLAPVDGSGGRLELRDLFDLDLSADLVVLSACETARGRLVGGEGVVGLTRAFLHAGATLVGASLFRADDRATAALMEGFYGRLAERVPPDQALRDAKIEQLRGPVPAHRHPRFWTAFVLVGRAW